MSDCWSVTWYHRGFGRKFADLPSAMEARQFAQVTALLSDCSDVRVLPPIGPLDLSPEQVAQSAAHKVVSLEAYRAKTSPAGAQQTEPVEGSGA